MLRSRAIVLIDGQNLYHAVKSAWAPVPRRSGTVYSWPSFDVERLAAVILEADSSRTIEETRFYTGVPDARRDPVWHGFWTNKLRYLRSRGIGVYRGRVSPSGQEKGVDVSIAIDLIRRTYEDRYDHAILVSSDSDLGPAVRLAKEISRGQGRRRSFSSAFPWEPERYTPRGVPGTLPIHIPRTVYDRCIDPRDYRIRGS